MKIKLLPQKSGKKVYYFKHQNGVLENKSNARYRAFTGFMVALFIFGGAGVLSAQIIKMRQKQSNSVQLNVAAIGTTKKADGEDKLKEVDKKAREDDQLAKKVGAKLKNVPGGQKWSVYIRDVKSDRMASINADNVYDAGSLGNLLVTVPLEAKYPSSQWNYRAGNTTVAKCVEALISAREANCRPSLDQYADLKNANGVFNGLGLKKTSLTNKEQKTSARDTGDFLFRLQNGQGLSDKARRVVFDGLYAHKQREGIPAGCKEESCLTANITAESNNIRHDAAIVTAGESKYVVVIMTKDASWSQIADVSADISTQLHP